MGLEITPTSVNGQAITPARISAASTTSEHVLSLNTSGSSEIQANVLAIRNFNVNTDSAIRFLDSGGKERGAVGYGNTGQNSAFPFGGRTYIEVSDVDATGTSPQFVVVQTSTFNSAISTTTSVRQHFDADGSIYIYPIGKDGNNLGSSNADFFLTWSTPGTAQGNVTLQLGSYPGGATNATIQCEDTNHAIAMRQSTASGGNGNALSFFEFGGTLASGSGYFFYTGGLKASQTLRLQIADDGISASVPVYFPTYAKAALPGASKTGGQIYVTDAAPQACPAYSDGTNWRSVITGLIIS